VATKKQLEKDREEYNKEVNLLRINKIGLESMIQSMSNDDPAKKDLEINLNAINAQLASKENELEKVTLELEEQYIKKQLTTTQNVVKALDELNAYYISSEKKWYCIYSETNRRHQPKVNVIDTSTMKDMVFGATNWYADNDKDLKEIALKNNRYYRDVERTFLPPSTNTLNQMTELQKFWLAPIYGQQHHEAFDLLMLNLVGGDITYKDQIEKYIAYSYMRPEDIFAPNIDSSAKGGVGRDTVFRILEIIFTEECCGEAKKETVQGTHNGELWGKVWVKISESNNRLMDINELKNLTGGHNFRLRRMSENAVQAPRTFRFFMMSNNYEGTARLTGGGSTAEDRRWEPVFSNTSLLDRVTEYLEGTGKDAGEILQEWQQNVYQNETEIAKWLGNIITKHDPMSITKLKPLHGDYYGQMVERQKNSFSIFMEKIISLSVETNCYDVDSLYKIYKIVSSTVMSKDSFGKKICEYLMTRSNVEWEMKVRDIYKRQSDDSNKRMRRQSITVKQIVKTGRPDEEKEKFVFDIFDFINETDEHTETICDEKGKELGSKPHANNIKQELF
jgi:hypothetical protein